MSNKIIVPVLCFFIPLADADQSFFSNVFKFGSDSGNIAESDIDSIVRNVQKSLPKVVDEKTVLKKFFVPAAGDLFVYDYQINEYKSKFTNASLTDFGYQLFRRSCADPSVLKLMSIKSGVVFQYKDRNDEFIASFKLLPNHCLELNAPQHLNYIGTSGGTALYAYKNSRVKVGDLASGSTLHEGKPYYYRRSKISSLKFNLEFNCIANLYKINSVDSFSKSFGVDFISSEMNVDGWKFLKNDLPLIKMAKDHFCN